MKVARSSVCKLVLAADDYQLLAGTESGKIISMDIVSGEVMWMMSASSTPVSALAIGTMDTQYGISAMYCVGNFYNSLTRSSTLQLQDDCCLWI